MKTNLGDPHRNFVDFAHVPVVKRLTRLPVCIDPSHSVGKKLVAPDGLLDIHHVTAQGIIAGANMVLVDFHPQPGGGALRRTAGADARASSSTSSATRSWCATPTCSGSSCASSSAEGADQTRRRATPSSVARPGSGTTARSAEKSCTFAPLFQRFGAPNVDELPSW